MYIEEPNRLCRHSKFFCLECSSPKRDLKCNILSCHQGNLQQITAYSFAFSYFVGVCLFLLVCLEAHALQMEIAAPAGLRSAIIFQFLFFFVKNEVGNMNSH